MLPFLLSGLGSFSNPSRQQRCLHLNSVNGVQIHKVGFSSLVLSPHLCLHFQFPLGSNSTPSNTSDSSPLVL